MKYIIAAPEMPYPANTGGRILVYKRIQYLSKTSDIYYFGIIDSEEERKYENELLKYCKEVHLYNRASLSNRIHTLLNLWRGPYACVSRTITQMQDDIEFCCQQNGIDFLLIQEPQMLGNVRNRLFDKYRIVVEQQNIEYVTMHNIAGSIKSLTSKCLYLMDYRRLKVWEESYYKKNILMHTFVSSEDKTFFEKWQPGVRTYLSPIGSELDPIEQPRQGNNIIYFGKMSYYPNAEAARWFALEVFPLIARKIPEAKYYIVGKDPLESLTELPSKNPNIIVTGTVDSVMEYYEKANVVVVPLSHGGGVKVKVLEALGHGKIVVSTNKGIEGTSFRSGYDLLTGDTPEDLATLITNVLTNPDEYEKIRKQGLSTIESTYTWQAILKDFESELQKQ